MDQEYELDQERAANAKLREKIGELQLELRRVQQAAVPPPPVAITPTA
ncbi:unnamed protein product, partial [Larinioides sclopetarius]